MAYSNYELSCIASDANDDYLWGEGEEPRTVEELRQAYAQALRALGEEIGIGVSKGLSARVARRMTREGWTPEQALGCIEEALNAVMVDFNGILVARYQTARNAIQGYRP